MSTTIKIGHTYKINKEFYKEQLQEVESTSLTKEMLVNYPFEFYSKKTRLFLDYDESSDDPSYITQKCNAIRDLLIEHKGHFQNGFVFTESKTHPTKVSFHVIFKKIHIIREDFKPEDEKELFCTLVGEENYKNIDTSVYGKKTCFRLPYGTCGLLGQSDKEHAHIPFTRQGEKENLSEYVLSVPDDTECKTYTTQLERAMKKQLDADVNAYKQYDEEPSERAQKLTRMLGLIKLERFQQYNTWLALCVLMKSNDLPQDLFVKMSEDSGYKYFDALACCKVWRDMKVNENFGIPLAIGWMKQDGVDIKKHFPIQSPILKQLLDGWYSQLEFTDMNIAQVLFTHYGDNLFYTSQGWFHYNGTWKMGTSSSIFHPIMKLLTEDLLTYNQAQLDKLIPETKSNDEDVKMRARAMIKQLQQLLKGVNSLQRACKIKSVLETAEGLFRDDKILDTFDAKPHWFCFSNNKAYDMKAGQVVDITSSDRILTTCGYDYVEPNSDEINSTLNMIKQLTPTENLDSLLSALSLFVYGENINEAFLVFKGEGGNGKGMLMTLLKKTLGDYYYDLPSSILTTQSKGDGRASPEMAQTRWARCVMFTEPDANKLIVKTKINELTGRDTITVRGLFKDPFSFMPKFVLGGMLNDMPRISGGISDSMKRRTKYQMFPYSFKSLDEYDDKNPLHRVADINMKERIRDDNRYRNGLLWIMLQTWMKNKGAYISCQADKEEANQVAKDNNPLIESLEEYEVSDTAIRIKELQKEIEQQKGVKCTAQEFKRFLEDAKVRIEEDKKHGHKVFLKKI